MYFFLIMVLWLWPICLLRIDVSAIQPDASDPFYQLPEYPRDCKEAQEHCSSDITSGVYTIKPDGYPQPFEVYCNNDDSSGGWTVIHRQVDGSLTLTRSWKDYKNGFGFLSSEFWIGNDKLSYLTNQAVYELRIDIKLVNGSSFYVNYNSFRISDEWNDYKIVSVKDFRSNWSCTHILCSLNMTQKSCTCQNVCNNPTGQRNCLTECEEICAPEGCFVTDTDTFIMNGESFINPDCTQNCTCLNNQLSCNLDYECSSDATCAVKEEVRKCYCNEHFVGDGESCTSNFYKDCYEAYQAGHTTDGIYTIMPSGWPGSPFDVFCNMALDGGGWTVFQRRIDEVTNFYRNWTEYKGGFGALEEEHDFWLGNERLHYLTDQADYILRIDLVHQMNLLFYDEYRTFKIGDESTKYRLSIGFSIGSNTGYGGVLTMNNGTKFSTADQDNDECNSHNYAQRHRGGWWYIDSSDLCNACYARNCRSFKYGSSGCYTYGTFANLNGDYNGGVGENIFHKRLGPNDCNHKFSEMKIRPSNKKQWFS